jgi:myo-inositol-1(or 4)-monophosphatase
MRLGDSLFDSKRRPVMHQTSCVEMSDEFHRDLLQTCEAAARAGGRELLEWRGRFGVREKGVTDFVTDADLASQEAIRRVIHARFPEHDFIGEERAPEEMPDSTDAITWVVDPLDGTTNYVHGYPHYAVSVAVARGSDVLAGVVFDPVADKCFSARAGGGAWCDGVQLRVSATSRVGEALVAVSLPARVRRDATDLLDFVEAVQRCRGVRRSGSAALNLAYVASGSLDAFWAAHIHPWDVAAGVLLVREAGGIVSGRDGAEFQLWNPHFVASARDELRRELLGVLTPFEARSI